MLKKFMLPMAGILAVGAFSPEASALPAFARQTGMACNACHQIHFPVLNGFGRAFKASGYTLMGVQGRIEGEHLSIPDTLNAAILMKYRYQKDDTPKTAGAGQTAATQTGDGQWQMGDELSLFFGGRVAEAEHFNIGFLLENNLASGNAVGGPVAGLRVPVTTDLDTVKVTVVPFATDSLGAAYGYELSSGGVMRANRWNEMRRNISAVQYNADRGADGGAASGTAFVVHNDDFYFNYTKWSSSFAPGAGGGAAPSTNFGQTFIRVAATPTIGDWAIVAGVGSESGTSYGNVADGKIEAKQTFVDFQAHGQIAEMESGIYAQYANAPACTDPTILQKASATSAQADLTTGVVTPGTLATSKGCAHNTGSEARTAMTIGGEMEVIPHTLIASLAYRKADSGSLNSATGKSHTDNAINVGLIYELAQNVELHFNYAKYSGTASEGAGAKTYEFLGMLEAAW